MKARLPARIGPLGGRRADGSSDPGPPLSGAPCPTHPLPEARGRSRGRRKPAARPSRPPGGAGAGGSAPRAVTASGRSRTRRRSALGGARPGRPVRLGWALIADTVLVPSGPPSAFTRPHNSLSKVVVVTCEDQSPQRGNVYYLLLLFSVLCFPACFSNSVAPDTLFPHRFV